MSVPGNRISILYVDDELSLLEIGKLFLEKGGQFSVDIITSAPAALALLKSKNYDAIISDYQMPEMDGIEFLKKVRTSGNTIPFILFTGRGREEVVIQALNEGADFYLQKGGNPRPEFTELSHKIRQAVQQRWAQISIRNHERREQDIINFQPDATFAIDTNGIVIAWSRAIEEMTDIPASQMLGKGDYEYALPFYGKRRPILIDLIFSPLDEIRNNYPNIVQDGTMLAAETTIPNLRGELKTLWCKASPLYDRNGEIDGAIESIRDITDHRLAEAELRAAYEQLAASEEELRSSYDNLAKSQRTLEDKDITLNAIVQESPIPQFVIDRNHKILYWNHALAVSSGIAADEIVGTDQQWRAFYPSKRPCLADLLVDNAWDKIPEWYVDKCAKSDLITGAYEATDFFPRIGKEGKWFHFTAGLIKNRNGDIIGAVESLEDITDRKTAELDLMNKNDEFNAAYEQLTAAEEELRSSYDDLIHSQNALQQSEERYRNVVEDQTEFICRFKPDGTHNFVNDAYCRYFDMQRVKIIGQKFTPKIPEEDKGLIRSHFASLTSEHPVGTVEHRIIMPEGSVRWHQWSDRAIFDESGALVEFQSVGRDITDWKTVELDLRKENEELRAAYEKRIAC